MHVAIDGTDYFKRKGNRELTTTNRNRRNKLKIPKWFALIVWSYIAITNYSEIKVTVAETWRDVTPALRDVALVWCDFSSSPIAIFCSKCFIFITESFFRFSSKDSDDHDNGSVKCNGHGYGNDHGQGGVTPQSRNDHAKSITVTLMSRGASVTWC